MDEDVFYTWEGCFDEEEAEPYAFGKGVATAPLCFHLPDTYLRRVHPYVDAPLVKKVGDDLL